ncbi:MAG TPA: methyltransferase domain-containing protein [Planctomycetaceae bacterium]|nr:methyltransferase domain-containing protein [Planctomycetaceae bacterium]
MRTLIAILFLCSTASAQSFTISGGNRSMIVSGSGPVIVKPAEVVVDTRVKTRVTPRKVITRTETTVDTVRRDQDYVVVFTTQGCPPCMQMKSLTIPELKRRKVHVVLIEDSAVAAQYGVTQFPVVMVARDGKQKKRWSGFVSTESLLQVIQTPEPQVQIPPQTGFYDSTIYDGQPGSSHRDRQSLIDHLVSEHAQNSAQLNGLSDVALNDLHNQFHATPRVTEALLPRYLDIPPYGTIDLATYSRTDRRGNPCQCEMCLAIYPYQRAYREQQARLAAKPVVELDIGQQATPMNLVQSGVREMYLTDADFFCDIGCGDGRWLIEATKTSGCQSVGIEYDHDLAELARAKIREAGLSDKIEVIEGDAREFDYSAVTAIACHLYDNLLSELASAGAFNSARVTVAPYHEVPGMQMNQRGGVWVAVR